MSPSGSLDSPQESLCHDGPQAWALHVEKSTYTVRPTPAPAARRVGQSSFAVESDFFDTGVSGRPAALKSLGPLDPCTCFLPKFLQRFELHALGNKEGEVLGLCLDYSCLRATCRADLDGPTRQTCLTLEPYTLNKAP